MLDFDFQAYATLFNAIGLCGFCLYVFNYLALTFRLIHADTTLYFTLNLLASSMVMLGLMVSFNLASALIQGFWIALSLIGIFIRLRPHRRAAVSRTV